MTDNQHHPLQPLIADYLNGHLNEAEARRFREALSRDPDLRARVELDARVRQSLREHKDPPLTPPDQLAFERVLQRKAHAPKRWRTLAPVALAATAIAAVGITATMLRDTTTPYETLTDQPVNHAGAVLRIAFTPALTLDGLLAEYELELIEAYPDARAADVRLAGQGNVDETIAALREDARIRFVEAQ